MKSKVISFVFFCTLICGMGAVIALISSYTPEQLSSLILMAFALFCALAGLIYWLIQLVYRYKFGPDNSLNQNTLAQISLVVPVVIVAILFIKANDQLNWPVAISLIVLGGLILLFLKRKLKVG